MKTKQNMFSLYWTHIWFEWIYQHLYLQIDKETDVPTYLCPDSPVTDLPLGSVLLPSYTRQ